MLNSLNPEPQLTDARQSNQIFRPNEYNPLRNPLHYSDARHLENKGINLPSDKADIRGGRRLSIKRQLFLAKLGPT